MKLEVNIDKKYLMIILGVIFLLAGSVVYAYGGSQPSVVGHSAGEVEYTCSWHTLYSDTHAYSGKSVQDHLCPDGKFLNGIKVYYLDYTGGSASDGTYVNSLYCCG